MTDKNETKYNKTDINSDIPDLNENQKKGSRSKLLFVILFCLLALGLISLFFDGSDNDRSKEYVIKVDESRPSLVLGQSKTKELVIIPQKISLAPPVDEEPEEYDKKNTFLERKKLSRALLYSRQMKSKPTSLDIVTNKSLSDNASADDSIKNTPLEVTNVRKNINQNFLLAKGTYIDCTLENALSSDVEGPVSCITSSDTYSSNGKYKLFNAGSKISGTYKANLTQGVSRLYVQWDRIQTTDGYIVKMKTPGTDALGRSGITGKINTHFWKRFGGAIMLSLIGDAISTIKANNDGNSNVSVSGTTDSLKDAASIALEHSIGIKPTLTKQEGGHINVFISRDIDFKKLIYGITS